MILDRRAKLRRAVLSTTFLRVDVGESPTKRGPAARAKPHLNGYYEHNAAAYAARTIDATPPPLLNEFLELVTPGGKVVDLGCGAGRDLARLVETGLDAEGYDLSPALAGIARQRSNAPVFVADMRMLGFAPASLDGVIAIASLLHLERVELRDQLAKIASWLKPGGLFLATMKRGVGMERDCEGRSFTLIQTDDWWRDLNRVGFERVAEMRSSAAIDVSSSDHQWLSTLARKSA